MHVTIREIEPLKVGKSRTARFSVEVRSNPKAVPQEFKVTPEQLGTIGVHLRDAVPNQVREAALARYHEIRTNYKLPGNFERHVTDAIHAVIRNKLDLELNFPQASKFDESRQEAFRHGLERSVAGYIAFRATAEARSKRA